MDVEVKYSNNSSILNLKSYGIKFLNVTKYFLLHLFIIKKELMFRNFFVFCCFVK